MGTKRNGENGHKSGRVPTGTAAIIRFGQMTTGGPAAFAAGVFMPRSVSRVFCHVLPWS
ncbi:MAG: hypothetical protein HSCHL_2175 [Hydrogenibacillus schlegelii]|uniref:Uncharacterized protein n=1 Tax=Hydrogenibacillus schlegelii TaxID=1484 RepID=A0A2T5G9X6_HYDSH|nr:MAG: hypothetical protein HSCHL_2175 [Hydrogenibacillus schlegelii]